MPQVTRATNTVLEHDVAIILSTSRIVRSRSLFKSSSHRKADANVTHLVRHIKLCLYKSTCHVLSSLAPFKSTSLLLVSIDTPSPSFVPICTAPLPQCRSRATESSRSHTSLTTYTDRASTITGNANFSRYSIQQAEVTTN
jgi:hypothetical protein